MTSATEISDELKAILTSDDAMWPEILLVNVTAEDGDKFTVRWRYRGSSDVYGKRFSATYLTEAFDPNSANDLASAIIANQISGPQGPGVLEEGTYWVI